MIAFPQAEARLPAGRQGLHPGRRKPDAGAGGRTHVPCRPAWGEVSGRRTDEIAHDRPKPVTQPDPIALFEEWYEEARRTDLPEPSAAALATVGADGSPSVRMVLIRGVDRRGFVFYTNLRSRKGHELTAGSPAALCFY